MAHFDFTRVGGIWSGSTTVTVAEFESLDSKTERAVNGDEGGTWAPSAPIVIGGDGLEVSGTLVVDGPSSFSDCVGLIVTTSGIIINSGADIQLQSGSRLYVRSGAELEVESGGLLTFETGSALEIEAGVDFDINTNVEVENAASIIFRSGSDLIVNSGAEATFQSGSVTALAGTTNQTGTFTKSGSGGRTVWRVAGMTTNANSTPDITADIWPVTINDGNTYAATCDVTSPAPTTGEKIIIRKIGTSGTLNINSEGPTAICAIGPGEAGCAELYFDGTQWRLISIWDSSFGSIFSGA